MRLPGDKFDLDAVGFPVIAPFLDDLVAWVADGNWPVASPVADLLASIGADAVPALRQALQRSDAIHRSVVVDRKRQLHVRSRSVLGPEICLLRR
ncbi:DUF5071 domain-containing protein [Rhizobium leguminosarum]|uniref:DUF5071 domain-containing protein n=1 Tax=Rhizobium leguminosarum TaxID=384 RepID=UPI003F998FB5